MSGRVTFVGAGPGAADLITLRGYKALQEADVVLYDSLVDDKVLEAATGEVIFAGKRCGKHSKTQEEISALLVEKALEGNHVVRLKGGDPAVLARTGEEALALVEAGLSYDIVPGVSSTTAAPLAAGIPLTHRGVADSFTVATAHKGRDEIIFSIPPYEPLTTLVLLMAVRTTPRWQEQLLQQRYPKDLPVAFITGGATPEQEVRVTTVAEAHITALTVPHASPTLAVVGGVVALREQMAWRDGDVDVSTDLNTGEGRA